MFKKALEGLAMLKAVSKAKGVTADLVDVLVKHNCTVGEARELMKGYYTGLDEAIQKDPSKLNQSLESLKLR